MIPSRAEACRFVEHATRTMVEWYYTLWKRRPGGGSACVWVCVSAVEGGGGVGGGSSLLYSLAVSRSGGASGAWVSDWVFELANSVAPNLPDPESNAEMLSREKHA